jgi:hypothetical protein
MARKVSDQVTTIGIDIGKNIFHVIGLGSKVPVQPPTNLGLLFGEKRSKSPSTTDPN